MPADTTTAVTSVTIPMMRRILSVEPDFFRERREDVEYEFRTRVFKADGSQRGAYGDGQNGTPAPNAPAQVTVEG